MRDMIRCEEVWCWDEAHGEDAWVAEVTVMDGFEDADEGDDEVCWCKFFESCPSCFGKK